MLTNSQDALYQRLCHASEMQAPWQFLGALELSSQPQSGDWAPRDHGVATNSVLSTLPHHYAFMSFRVVLTLNSFCSRNKLHKWLFKNTCFIFSNLNFF